MLPCLPMDVDDNDKVMEGEVLPYLPSGRLSQSSLRRAQVVEAFHTAFQMIGGVPRLALWADSNPGEFFKLYARMLPSAASDEMNLASAMRIEHALPPPNYSPLAMPAESPTESVSSPSDDTNDQA